MEEEEEQCQSLPELCSGREYILALERDDDPSSKNGERERQCKVMGRVNELSRTAAKTIVT